MLVQSRVWQIIVLLAIIGSTGMAQAAGPIRVYLGSYTDKASQGIYVANLDAATGALTPLELAGEMDNPSFLAIHPGGKFLYACGEFGHKINGSIAGFSIEANGKLKPINQQPLDGGPCYLTVDATGRNVMAACYGSGVVANFKIGEDGKLAPSPWIEQHPGAGTKQPPHAHCIDPDPANRFVLSADLGLNRVYVYRLDPAAGLLTPNDPPFATLVDGSGPRHLVCSGSGKFVYTINELASTLTAFSYDADKGVLHEIQNVSTLPKDFAGKSFCAELIMHPSGKFLYGSNRGHDSIVQFAVDEQTGRVTVVGHTPTGGKIPRGFGIDPTGNWMIVGNQNSDNIVEFHIDPQTGEPKPTGVVRELSRPVCVKFLAVK